MRTLSESIRYYRTLRGFSQKELSLMLGEKSPNIIYNWENDIGKPDYIKMRKLCAIFNITADELIDMPQSTDEIILTCEEKQLIKDYRSLDEFGKELINTNLKLECKRLSANRFKSTKQKVFRIDFYSLPASAGTGSFIKTETPESIYIKDTPEAEFADYAIRVKGDSMNPTYKDGDTVLVKKQDTLAIGEIGIFVLNNESFIKQLGENELISHNAEYKPIHISENDSIYCCGKVVGIAERI